MKKPAPAPLSPRATTLLGRVENALHMKPVINRNYVIKNWLDRGAVSVVYGDANVGKSFFAVDLAHHVQEGQRWGGCAVRQGPVLYVAAEGGDLFSNRVAALKSKFWVLRGAVNLASDKGDGAALADVVCHLAGLHGPFALIVVDTLARSMGSADENAAADVAGLLKGVDLIRERTGAHVMLVHHSGKNKAQGARGHSSLRAAIDTEIELTIGDGGIRVARTTKQRDMPSGREFLFRLRSVELGKDDDGEAVTTCVVDWTN
jgi:hypothetical protein